MNVKEKLMSVAQKLGLVDKIKNKTLTHEDWNSLVNSYKEEFQANLHDDMDAEIAARQQAQTAMSQEDLNALQSILGSEQPIAEGDAATQEQQPATFQNIATQARIIVDENANLRTQVEAMAQTVAPDKPEHIAVAKLGINGTGTTATYLFGIEHSMFSMEKRWNKISANPSFAGTKISDDVESAFHKDLVAYSRSLATRFEYLNENHLLDADKLAAGEFTNNFDGVEDAKVGDQFVIRRQDALIARVLKKRDLTQWFPVRYGIQDHDLVFNAFFDEVSQAYQEGEVWKGGMKIENEMGHVDDAMIKMKFGPMKKLERMYIGYLNKEGSDPIKWSMIEFAILNSLETAQVEQNKRRMRGIYVKPEAGVPSHFLNSGTGIIYTLIRYVHENKLLLHDDEAYHSYTETTMLDAVKEYVKDVESSCTEDMDLDSHVLYLNKMHRSWWLENCRTKYGKDTDFTGPDSYANVVPDTTVHIVWLPYLGQLPLMFMDVPGNIQLLEYIAGEMMALKAKEDMEMVKTWSTWKEGCAAAFVGRRLKTREELIANNYEFQQIFMNKPSVMADADATKLDAKAGFWFETVENTQATAITDITGAKKGVAYIIECGSVTNASTIAKADKFADITSAYTPTKVGDYIMVILNAAGNFRELERCVGGVRTVNAELQPNLPGVR